MPMPNLAASPDRMPAEEVLRWLETVKARGLAINDMTAADLIGKSPDTLQLMKKRGADRTTALACAAVLRHLTPFGEATGEATAKRTYAVSVPVTLTVEIEAVGQGDAQETAREMFQHQGAGSVLTGTAIPLGSPGENVVVRSAVLASGKLRVAEVAA